MRKLPNDDDYVFVNPISDEFYCPICLNIFNNPIITNCGHSFCKNCLEKTKTKDNQIICPLCKENIINKQSNLLINSLINNLQVYCKFGIIWNDNKKEWEKSNNNLSIFCSKIIPLSLKKDHEKECEYRIVRCKYWTLGCLKQIVFKYIIEHEENCFFYHSKNEFLPLYNKIKVLEDNNNKQNKQIKQLQEENKIIKETLNEFIQIFKNELNINNIKDKFNEINTINYITDDNITNNNEIYDDDNNNNTINDNINNLLKENSFSSRIQNIKDNPLSIIQSISHDQVVECITKSSKYIISGCWDSHIRLWDINEYDNMGSFEVLTDVRCLLLENDYNLYIGGSQATITLWDIDKQLEIERNIINDKTDILSLIIIDSILFISSCSSSLFLKDKYTLETKDIMNTSHSNWIFSLEKCGDYLLSGSSDSIIKLWNPKTLQLIHSFTGHSNQIRSLSSINNNTIASGSYDETIAIWDIRDKQNAGTCKCNAPIYGIKAVETLILSGDGEGCVSIWDTRILDKPITTYQGHTDCIYDFENINQTILSCSADGLVNV